MTEDEARRVELVRAIEGEDGDALLLTREDREQADAQARSTAAASGTKAGAQFIAARADFAAARLTTRHPGISALLQRNAWPGWVNWAVPLAALAIGFFANEFGTSKRLDLIAVPLLGTIGWNLLAYLWLALLALSGKRAAAPTPLIRGISRISGLWRPTFDQGTALHRAANNFQHRWAELSEPLTQARIARTLHLSAMFFATGLIGGIYLRALVIEYWAGWESTFLGPETVHALLSAMLGPASFATGVAIPPLAEVAAMRWTGPATGGVNAGPWIHLYTATILGLVVAPRLALSVWQGTKVAWLSRRFPVAGREDFYFRRLLRAAGAKPGVARVTPYAYRPGADTRSRLTQALRAALGDEAQVHFDEPIDYGAEEAWLADHTLNPADDYLLILFTLSATPEAENHGVLASALAARIANDHPGMMLGVLLDETPFRTHFSGQAGLGERIEGRIAAWRRVLREAGVIPVSIDLSQDAGSALAQQLESSLLADGAMRG